MKVFGIGLHSSGLSLLRQECEAIGLKVCPRKEGRAICEQVGRGNRMLALTLAEQYDVCIGSPWNFRKMWPLLDQVFPRSLFILTHRPAEGWFQSLLEFVQRTGSGNWIDMHLTLGTAFTADKKPGIIRAYRDYNNSVRRHFAKRTQLCVGVNGTRSQKSPLLCIDSKAHRWPKVCEFVKTHNPERIITPRKNTPVARIANRDGFGEYCNKLGLCSFAVEVGTDTGYFASRFLSTWRGHRLFCIDPWETVADYTQKQWDRTPDLLCAVLTLAKFMSLNRCRLLRSIDSQEVVDSLRDEIQGGTIDFVHIDGNHSYPAAKKDIEIWWPVVRPGGILSGHDYSPGYHDGVVQAVDEFGRREGVEITVLDCMSWFVRKALDG